LTREELERLCAGDIVAAQTGRIFEVLGWVKGGGIETSLEESCQENPESRLVPLLCFRPMGGGCRIYAKINSRDVNPRLQHIDGSAVQELEGIKLLLANQGSLVPLSEQL
jgi:hypothetical protein